jgi:hypothetical protein
MFDLCQVEAIEELSFGRIDFRKITDWSGSLVVCIERHQEETCYQRTYTALMKLKGRFKLRA